jgi:hypothetical protein
MERGSICDSAVLTYAPQGHFGGAHTNIFQPMMQIFSF